ncbi:MAG: hypothetical protein ISS70_01585 [Phycisphaerae bacterium]|nr:hypothetical protein [Phycisphaerae bacterium]
MYEQERLVSCGDVVIAESALLRRERKNRYGSVPGLDDSELAGPDELERQVLRQEFAPVLALPVSGGRCSMRPNIEQDGSVDWGAFGTVDFDRCSGGFDKVRYKADKVREQLKNLLILLGIVNERIKTRAKYLVLKYLRMGIIELEHIENNDMRALARLYLRARRMRTEIAELWEASERRRQRKAETLWASV